MSTICNRCALRIQRAAQAEARQISTRSFSSTANQQRGVPTFEPSSSTSLNEALSLMRTKHFIPGYLPPTTRRLIFGTKHRQSLLDNPQTALIGDEEVPLTWMDRRTEIPNRTKLLRQALELMEKGEKRDWQNLRPMLVGLKHIGATLEPEMMERIVRKAVNKGQVGQVLRCLEQSKETGLTLERKEIVMAVARGLREQAQRAGWSESAVKSALGSARKFALLLETEEHGGGAMLRSNDARQKPAVIGVFLELAAVDAYKHHGGKDVSDTVRVYAARLLSCMPATHTQPRSFAPPATGAVTEMLDSVPIWHGLMLAQKILGDAVPEKEQVEKIVADYGAGLTNLATAIEAKDPKEGSYGAQALRVWRDCIRD